MRLRTSKEKSWRWWQRVDLMGFCNGMAAWTEILPGYQTRRPLINRNTTATTAMISRM
jgi:hypothetical protein